MINVTQKVNCAYHFWPPCQILSIQIYCKLDTFEVLPYPNFSWAQEFMRQEIKNMQLTKKIRRKFVTSKVPASSMFIRTTPYPCRVYQYELARFIYLWSKHKENITHQCCEKCSPHAPRHWGVAKWRIVPLACWGVDL